ncbi:DUF2339 domain-containing protein [Sandarakinorhabdus sp. DWP1-3-1]|uniref:DUF2339 domain-containing protein n=1 Tax=Sandarakinorhabdus sp. DWP1-3-1 TaxID=2804627 RepID=UPI003CEB19A5
MTSRPTALRSWGLVIGALAGGAVGEAADLGFVIGAIVGLVATYWLVSAINAEIRARVEEETATLADVLRAEFRRAQTQPVPVDATRRPPLQARAPAAEAIVDAADDREAIDNFEAGDPDPDFAPAAADPWQATRQPEPMAPAEPGLLARAFTYARNWLFGGNTIVRVGLVILFVGLSFLARYAAMSGLLPIEFRLAAIGAAGIALLVVGFLRREARPDFALALQGGGVAVIYLTIFGAARFYELLPPMAALVLMIIVCAFGCALALLQNSQVLAAAAFAGGFAVPVLVGGDGDGLGLFSYYAVLNFAVLFIAQRRSWRVVNLIGFFATFGVATAWGVLSYTPASYVMAQSFLILFILIYVTAAILHARNTPGRLGNFVDSTLLFGPALVGFGLQVGLVRHLQYGDAISALVFAAIYVGLATFLARRAGPGYRLLVDAMVAIGTGFVTLAIPLALGARWTSSAWAIEGAGAFWVGLRQQRWLPRLFGLGLIAVSALMFPGTIGANMAALPLLGPQFLGATLIAAALLAVAWWLRPAAGHTELRAYERTLPNGAFVVGFLYWCLAIALEATRLLPPTVVGGPVLPAIDPDWQTLATMLGVVASAFIASLAGRRFGWRIATWPGRLTLLPLGLTLIARQLYGHDVLDTPDWAAWLIAIGLHVALLRANDRDEDTSGFARLAHIGSVWLAMLFLADIIWVGIDRAQLWNTAWAAAVPLLSAAAVLAGLAAASGSTRWPIAAHRRAYAWTAALPIAVGVYGAALVAALGVAGDAAPLPYIPLLNPIELVLGLAIAALLLWQRAVAGLDPLPAGGLTGRNGQAMLAWLAFIVINTVWLRIAHQLLGAPWSLDGLIDSPVVQTGLSILWTLLALALMLVAHRRVERSLWLTGAVLLGAVVVKLLLVDLSATGGGQRIVAFIAVGVLMLIVGYFVPLPPRAPEERPA